MLPNPYHHTLNINLLHIFPIPIHVQLHPKYSITNNLYKTGVLLIMVFINPLVLDIHQLDI